MEDEQVKKIKTLQLTSKTLTVVSKKKERNLKKCKNMQEEKT